MTKFGNNTPCTIPNAFMYYYIRAHNLLKMLKMQFIKNANVKPNHMMSSDNIKLYYILNVHYNTVWLTYNNMYIY